MSSPRRALLLALLLASCGGLPRPFEGRPGSEALRLAEPPPARLAIAPPAEALLGDAAAATLAAALAGSLQEREVPAVPEKPRAGDWRLAITAERRPSGVVPVFTVLNPQSAAQGTVEGAPVPSGAWAEGAPELLRGVAEQATPGLATLLTRIEAARRQSDPNSLSNRPARVVVAGVNGAPGDGNVSLARQMRDELTKRGLVVQDTPNATDFTVLGDVATKPAAGGQIRVEIIWTVQDARGREAGKIVQLNEVPNGTLSGLWADVAVVVAQEASGGVRDVILNRAGLRKAENARPGAQPGADQPR